MTEIRGKSAVEVWKKALKHIMENGLDYINKKGRLCREYLNLILTIENSKNIDKPIEILNSFGKWVYPPSEELRIFIFGKREVPGYYYHYGERAFNPEWRNQIEEYVIPILKTNPVTKRALVVFYNPKKDSYINKKETPGMIMMNFNLRRNKLHITAVIRSNDMFHGWPGNICQTQMIQEDVCKQIGCQPGKIATISISAHIFEDQFDDIEKVISMKRKY
jgi:thymidylate synthase